jgi:Lipopolysaccharide kinase (Kdo/WaaP) family
MRGSRIDGIEWRDPSAQEIFAKAGLRELCDFLDCRRGVEVTEARTRSLRRLELGEQCWYLKIQDLRGKRLPLSRLPSYLFKGSPVAREARSLESLRALGILVPDLVASGQAGFPLPFGAMLLTRSLPGYVDLVAWLETRPDPELAREVLLRAEALVHDLHARGHVLMGAKYRNILVQPDQTNAALALIDQPDLSRSRSARRRRKDLQLLAQDRLRYADWIGQESGK